MILILLTAFLQLRNASLQLADQPNRSASLQLADKPNRSASLQLADKPNPAQYKFSHKLQVARYNPWSVASYKLALPQIISWLTEKEHDFGTLRTGATSKFVFRFKNAGTEPLVLQTVRTTCGCTAADWTEEAILPGEDGAITIEFSAERSGSFRKKIKVFFDKQKKPEILYVQGEVE